MPEICCWCCHATQSYEIIVLGLQTHHRSSQHWRCSEEPLSLQVLWCRCHHARCPHEFVILSLKTFSQPQGQSSCGSLHCKETLPNYVFPFQASSEKWHCYSLAVSILKYPFLYHRTKRTQCDSRNLSSPSPLPCTTFRLNTPATSSAWAIAALASELLGGKEREESKFERAVARADASTRVSSDSANTLAI